MTNHTSTLPSLPTVGSIGIFDSGYGGLTIASETFKALPEYDFIYLGDNARSPYGTRSFELVYTFTLQAVRKLFQMGCNLIILACNTASAKALRTIQQNDLPRMNTPHRRVLGIIRPTVEAIGEITQSGRIGLLGTEGTVNSGSYPIELAKLYPQIKVYQEACPMWVPLVEMGESDGPGADYFVQRHITHLLSQEARIDTLVPACTHYPLLLHKIRQFIPPEMRIVSQGKIVADSLIDYLKRHPEMDRILSRNGQIRYYTTENEAKFASKASIFLKEKIEAHHINLETVN